MTRIIVGLTHIIVGVLPHHRRAFGVVVGPGRPPAKASWRQGRFRLAPRTLIHYMTLIR
jgi:hypothetical protein